jgi:hypothetical protein
MAKQYNHNQCAPRLRPRCSPQGPSDTLPKSLPQITLRHGQVIWLLTELGYSEGATAKAFYEYIKSLRKFGIPFGDEKFRTKRGRRLANYSYCHVMEIVIALSLRVYHVVPDAILKGIATHRKQLWHLYHRAYAERCVGMGTPISLKFNGHKPIEYRGLFLDLNILFSGGNLVHFGPPRVLSPAETLARFGERSAFGQTFMPLSLSVLAELVVAVALRAPEIHSGPLKS